MPKPLARFLSISLLLLATDLKHLSIFLLMLRESHKWRQKTLIAGPSQPVDGDSIASCKAMLLHLRNLGIECYIMPSPTMRPELKFMLNASDFHPGLPINADFTVDNLQSYYDSLLAIWKPGEIVVLDGQPARLGFDPLVGARTFTIDHHIQDGICDNAKAYIQASPATGCLLINHFGITQPVLAVAILTDTFGLRKNNPAQALDALHVLRQHGLTDELFDEYLRNLETPHDPRIIEAINKAEIRQGKDTALFVLGDGYDDIHAEVTLLLSDYHKHLCVVGNSGYARFRTSDPNVDLIPLGQQYGGGGHRNMAVGQLKSLTPEAVSELFQNFTSCVSTEGKQLQPAVS